MAEEGGDGSERRPKPLVNLNQLRSSADELVETLGKKRETLGARESAPYFRKFANLIAKAARFRRKDEQAATREVLAKVFYAINNSIKPDEKQLKEFLHKGHGAVSTLLWRRPWPYEPETVSRTYYYNAYHWKGVAELLEKEGETGTGEKLQWKKGVLGGQASAVAERIAVTPKILRALVKNTPHLLEHGMRDFVDVSVKGSAKMTYGELFALLRSASNSLHSIKLQAILHSFKNALDSPKKLKKAVEYLSSKEHFREYVRQVWSRLSPEEIEARVDKMYAMLPRQLSGGSLIPPTEKESVLSDITARRFDSFTSWHFNVLARAAGLPPETAMLVKKNEADGLKRKEVVRLMKSAKGKAKLRIELRPGKAVITDTGLGRDYPLVARYRLMGGTSDFLQQKAAEIVREIGPKSTRITLNFR